MWLIFRRRKSLVHLREGRPGVEAFPRAQVNVTASKAFLRALRKDKGLVSPSRGIAPSEGGMLPPSKEHLLKPLIECAAIFQGKLFEKNKLRGRSES